MSGKEKDQDVKQDENLEANVNDNVEDVQAQEAVENDNVEELDENSSEFLKKRIEGLEAERDDFKNQFLRKHADFENYRKRMAKEKADSVKYGNQELLKDLVEILDNFDRAIKAGENSDDIASFREGITMIEQQFASMLQSKWGLEKMVSTGKEYDPNEHEALMMEDSEDVEVPTVLEDYQAGFKLHDRVIRPSKVKVGKPVAKKTENED